MSYIEYKTAKTYVTETKSATKVPKILETQLLYHNISNSIEILNERPLQSSNIDILDFLSNLSTHKVPYYIILYYIFAICALN